MSGYSKVTVNKVKKTLKATGVSMRMTPVRLRKLASFMTRFLFVVSLFGPDQPQRAHLPSSKAPEPVLSAQRPLILCHHSAPSTRSPSSGRSMRSHAPPCYPLVSHIHHSTCATGSPVCLTLTIIHTPGTPSLPEPPPQSREKAL